MLSLALTTGAVEVHSLDYSTVLFVSFDSMRVDGDVKNFFFYRQTSTLGKVLAMQIVL